MREDDEHRKADPNEVEVVLAPVEWSVGRLDRDSMLGSVHGVQRWQGPGAIISLSRIQG